MLINLSIKFGEYYEEFCTWIKLKMGGRTDFEILTASIYCNSKSFKPSIVP